MDLHYIFNIQIKMSLKVINLKGEKEPFSSEKIYKACLRSGASEKTAREITKEIKNQVYEEIKTEQIGKIVRKLLEEKSEEAVAIKFCLKKAMRDLGPSGFSFEKFIVAILEEKGFQVDINQIMPGRCITNYEIDFVVKMGEKRQLGECKYRSDPKKKTDLRVALYNYARFLDISNHPLLKDADIEAILITNAKFTSKAIKYSECNKVKLLGWRYPKTGGLEKLIEETKLYPITILPSFDQELKNAFSKKNLMLVKDLLKTTPKTIANLANISIQKSNQLTKEANILLEK